MANTTNSNRSKNKALWWGVFLISTVACIALLMFADSWFWTMLPFQFTALVLALDVL